MAALTHYLATELEGITYSNSKPEGITYSNSKLDGVNYPNSEVKACRVLSKIPGEETGMRPRKVGEVADAGSVISCLFYDVSRSLHPSSTGQLIHENSPIITAWRPSALS